MLQSGKTRMLRREDATVPAHFFTIFHENFRQGYDCIKKAVDLEEQCKNGKIIFLFLLFLKTSFLFCLFQFKFLSGIPSDKTKQKVRAAELYKEGREYFKEVERFYKMFPIPFFSATVSTTWTYRTKRGTSSSR